MDGNERKVKHEGSSTQERKGGSGPPPGQMEQQLQSTVAEQSAVDHNRASGPPPLISEPERAIHGAQSGVSFNPMQLPELSDEVHVQVIENATNPALVYKGQDGKLHEMPCKVNRSLVQLAKRPLTKLLGHAAAADNLCKDEHFSCFELKPDNDLKGICDFCGQCKVEGFAGIILVNFKDDVDLPGASWKIVLDLKVTVVVVSKCHGDTLLKMLGSDVTHAPPALTRFVYFKIYPKQSAFKIFKGEEILQPIPFQMVLRACCLTLDRVRCLHFPLDAAPTDNEPFFYVHSLKPGDTYASIVMAIPVNMRNSKSMKGIMIICYKMELSPKFFATSYASDVALLPLYFVPVEHGQLLLPKVQPQQPLSGKAGSVQPQGAAAVQPDNPEALHIRFLPKSGVLLTKSDQRLNCSFMGSVPLGQFIPCHPCSESPSISGQNYRYLKLRPLEKCHELLERIQKMQRVDKSGHVVGFIIGSPLKRSAKLPVDVFKELDQLAKGNGKLPPLIVLKEEDYHQLTVNAMSHSFSVKEIQCLSDIGSLKIGKGATRLPVGDIVRCQVKEPAAFSVEWLPLLGHIDEASNATPYVRVVPLHNGEVPKDVLHLVENELHSRSLNYVVMANSKLVKRFERTAAVIKVEDGHMLSQHIGEVFFIAQDQPESVSWRFLNKVWKFFGGATVAVVPRLNSFNWSSTDARGSLQELGPHLQQWKNVQDKPDALKILKQTLTAFELKHFPLFILVAIQLQDIERCDLVKSLYDVARKCDERQCAQILTDFTKSGDITLEGGPKSVFSTMADGMEMFLDVKETTLFRIFWITLCEYFNNIAGRSKSGQLWRGLSKASGWAPLPIETGNMKEMMKWLALASHLYMDTECQLSFEILLTMIKNDRFRGFTFSNAWILLSELHDAYFMEPAHAEKVLAQLRLKQAAQTLVDVKEGIKLLERIIPQYQDDRDMKRELLLWMRMLASVKSGVKVTQHFVMLKEFLENMVGAALQEEMLTTVKEQMSISLEQTVRTANVPLNEFAQILKGLPFLQFKLTVVYFQQFSCNQVPKYGIHWPSFTQVCNLALERFYLSEPVHEMIATVLRTSLTHYARKPDRQTHLQNLLNLDVPKLFELPSAGAQTYKWLQVFEDDWKKYIKDKQLQMASQECLSTFLTQKRGELTSYQKVAVKVLIPYIRITKQDRSHLKECPAFQCLESIAASMVQHYNTMHKWKEISTPLYDSFWDIINVTASEIPVKSHDLTWCQDWRPLLKLLLKLYQRFQEMTNEEPFEDLNNLLDDQNIRTYFKWVAEARKSLKVKAAGFVDEDWSEEDASHFDSMKEAVIDISKCLHIDMTGLDTDSLLKEANESRRKAVEILFRCSHGEKQVQMNSEAVTKTKKMVKQHVNEFIQLILLTKNRGAEWVWLPVIVSAYHITEPEAIQGLISAMFKSKFLCKQFVEHIITHGDESCKGPLLTREEFRRDVSLKSLKNAVNALEELVRPLEGCMEDMVVFHSRDSLLFKEHVELTLNGKETFQDFVLAMTSAAQFLKKFKSSQVTHLELQRLHFFDQRKVKQDREIHLLQEFYVQKGEECTDFLAQLQDMSNLLEALKLIPGITKVFDTFDMQNCLTHCGYQALVELENHFSTEVEQGNLTGAEACERMKKVLVIIDPLELQQLELFSVVGRSEEFYIFLKSVEQQGTERFQDLHRLITQYMQHEEYNEAVLNQLPRAREYMLPFLDQEQDFNTLLKKVKAMCDRVAASEDFSDLETINTNMNLIRLWFSRAEDHTLESVQKDLVQIMDTGVFLISDVQQSLSDSSEGCLLLKYDSIDDPTADLWKEDAISDFNRRLGLLERKEDQTDDMNENVDKFQYNYKIARKVFQIWLELKSMRSPKATIDLCLQCSASKEAAEEDLRLMKLLLKEWKDTLHEMRMKHPELRLFKIHKVFQMFSALQSANIETLVQEMLLLFTNKHQTGPRLLQAIKDALHQVMEASGHALLSAQDIMETRHVQREEAMTIKDLHGASTIEENDPIEIVGTFLTSALKLLKHHLPDMLTHREHIPSGVLPPVVHKAVHYSQRELLVLLWSEYNGKLVSPFEIYRCRKGTTEEDLSLFFSRMQQFSSVYTLLDVNILPLRLQEVIVKLHKEAMRKECNSSIHYVVSGPSLMQDLPNVTVKMIDHDRAMSTWSQFKEESHVQTRARDDFSTVEIVYGRAGDGKSQYILKKLKSISSRAQTVTLTINESFSVADAIKELRVLPLQLGNALYLNFTLLPASDSSSEQDKQAYEMLVTRIQCFLFDLFFLGYVEDPQSGHSFSMPRGLKWHVYVEVPTREFRSQGSKQSDAYTLEEDRWNDPDKSLELFCEEYPVLQLVGTPRRIYSNTPLDIDEHAQLVCKYLQAYENKEDSIYGIDRYFRGHESEKVTFKSKPDCPKRECQRLLNVYMPKNAKLNKMNCFMCIRYMARRCMFLDVCPAYNYNQVICYKCKNEEGEDVLVDTSKLGSSLLESMLKEVDNLCSVQRRRTWGGSGDSRQQLIYVSDGMMEENGGCFELVALNPDDIPEEDRRKYDRLQVPINERENLESRDCLDKYLASAFGVTRVEVKEDGKEKLRLKEIDAKNYVLTLDFAMKMLELNERYHAGVPVIIEGETGVGKTFLVEMMADLWNSSLLSKWNRTIARLWTKLAELCKDLCMLHSEASHEMKVLAFKIVKTAENETASKILKPELCTPDLHLTEEESRAPVMLGDLNEILQQSYVFSEVVAYLKKFLKTEPLLPLLEFKSDELNRKERTKMSFDDAEKELRECTHPSQEVCGIVLLHILKAAKPKVYFKKNIHGALTSKDMRDFMKPIIHRANEVKKRWKNPASCPRIVVFLDEINTTSCPGLMKELLVDRSFHGECLPKNVFIIGACNPHRGNSVAIHEKAEDSGECDWVKGSYYVHRLHPTVRCLLWNYGALDEEQEERYIEAKMKMAVNRYGSSTPLRGGTHLELLSSHIFESQYLVREFAEKHYEASGIDEEEAKELARSCVSQRDIQRVFTMYEWLLKAYDLFQRKNVTDHKCYDRGETWQQRAILVSLGLVYYFRLNNKFREEYKAKMEEICGDITFTEALDDEMNFYCDTMRLPPGIAKTTALKENLFCIIACCCTKTPLIIVGEPGSSKTLSFNLAAAAFRGIESKIELFKNTEVFPGFDPYYYQCSRRTTSVEVETVFRRAVNRQKAHEVNGKDKFHCVVFMDEAGLPEESMESLKVLHKYLDDAVVSFVGITNHILDAAKSNRAVTLFRPRAADDVSQLAMGCFGLADSGDHNTHMVVYELCQSYDHIIGDDRFTNFFGLRDFVHLVNYLRRETKGRVQMLIHNEAVRTELVLGGVQRNFNGHQQFDEVCKVFCNVPHSRHDNWKGSLKNLVQLLHETFQDRPFFVDQEDFEEIRYKLIIDPTEDESSRRFMMEFGLLHPNEAKTLVGSDFPDDGDLQRINTIAEITHAASQGATVLMLQTDDIHESFYDLFNQHFRKIPVKGEGGKRTHFYANVAIGSHSKPCRVHPKFQCIVVIKESDLATTPAPFLNRFEKYRLSPKMMLEAALDYLPRGLRVVVHRAKREVLKLVNKLHRSSFCGMRMEEDTILSVFLSMVPKTTYTKVCLSITEPIIINEDTGMPSASLLKALLEALKKSGFSVSEQDVDKEWDIVSSLVKGDSPSLSHSDIDADVTDAWADLTDPDTTSDPQDHLVRFIQAILCYWMYASAAKKILQILTPEALILWRRSKAIPHWYFDTYLKQQHHFNLKELIMSARNATQQSSSKGFLKVVCFTRSSQTVSQLSAAGDTDEEKVIAEVVVTSKPQRVKLCQMSTVASQQEFSEQLAEFQNSSEKDIMLIVANMHEATKKLINYVRLRIDEEEEKWLLKVREGQGKQKRISAIEEVETGSVGSLLISEQDEQEIVHAASESEDEVGSCDISEDEKESQSFPSRLGESCEGEVQITDKQSAVAATNYPMQSSVPIEQPVEEQTKAYVLLLHFPPSVSQRACYPAMFLYGWDYHYLDSLVASAECAIPLNEWCHVAFQQTAAGIEQERVAIDWHRLLDRTASVMASRIALYDRSKGTTTPISAREKADMFRKLLQGPLGQKLQDLYSSYWSPKNVARFLQGAAVYARCRMSMISVTDVVQNFFESTLHNFLAYMLYHISEELGLDTYVDETKELFLALLEFVPRPKSVSDLKSYNNTWGISSDVSDQLQASQFPGFSKICASIETCLRKRFDEMMVDEECAQSLPTVNLRELSEQLQAFADTLGQDRLKTVLPYLKDATLWQRYEADFIKFQFAVTNFAKMKDVLEAVVSHSCTVDDSNLERLVALHYLAFSRHHDVTALEAVINPLQRIQVEGNPLTFSSVLEKVLVQGRKASQSEMAYFIIENLFGSLMSCSEDSTRLDWLKTCRSILFTPNMEMILYSSEYGEDYHGKFNVVQAVFLLLQSAQDDTTMRNLHRCLTEVRKSEKSFDMEYIFTTFVDIENTSINNQDYVSRLCLHFFHSSRPHFSPNDVSYFFQFVATLQFERLNNGTHCVTLGVLKHFMLIVLRFKDSEGGANNYELSSKATRMLGEHLQTWTKITPEDYHPPCFGTEESEIPSSLAHMYFVTLLDHLRPRFEGRRRAVWTVEEMLKKHSKELPSAESSVVHAIEKQVLVHLFTKELAAALCDDKQAKKIGEKRKDLFMFLCNDRLHKQLLMEMLSSHTSKEKAIKVKTKVKAWFPDGDLEADSEREVVYSRCHLKHRWTYDDLKSSIAQESQQARQKQDPHVLLLHRLLDSHEKLNAGLDLIPILLLFCAKLKKHLDFKCHEQDASGMTLRVAVEKACSEMKSGEERKLLQKTLQNKFIEKFCEYQSTLGRTRGPKIGAATPLRDIFSLTDERRSVVYQTLDDICATCNSFIGVVQKCATQSRSFHLLNWVTLGQPPVNLLQYHETWQLLSRPLNKESIMECLRQYLPVFGEKVNFEQLSAEVVKTFFCGLSVSAIEMNQISADKVFRLSCQSTVKRGHSSATEYVDICTQLREFQGELEVSCRKDIFAHFHGVNHRALQSVVDGLLMIAHHLTQTDKDALHWANHTLSRYIQSIGESYTIKDFVNLPRDMSGALDLHFLETFQVGNLLGCLNLFVNWIETGFCNFHTLPLGVKKDMSAEMVQSMEEIAADYTLFLVVHVSPESRLQSFSNFASNLQTLIPRNLKTILVQAEQNTKLLFRLEEAIPPEVMGFGMGEFDTAAFELPLKQYLKEHRICKSDTLLQCIPEEVQLQHYVNYLILIRRLTESERLPTPSDETDMSDSEEEEIVESEGEEEEEEQQREIKEEAAVREDDEEDLAEDDSLRNLSAGEQPEMYSADITSEGSSHTLQREDSNAISENKSDDEYRFKSDSDLESDDAAEDHSNTEGRGLQPENLGMDNESSDEFLSASSGDEETFSLLLKQSRTVKEAHQTETVLVHGAMHVSTEAKSTITQEVVQQQPATDLVHHQIQDAEDTLEQVIDVPEQTEAVMNVRQPDIMSEQGEMCRSALVEETPTSTQLPESSTAGSVKTPSNTMQVDQPKQKGTNQLVTVDDVCEWLKNNKMSQYVDMFKSEEVDGKLLSDLDEDALKELGVEKSLYRKKILRKIKEMKE